MLHEEKRDAQPDGFLPRPDIGLADPEEAGFIILEPIQGKGVTTFPAWSS